MVASRTLGYAFLVLCLMSVYCEAQRIGRARARSSVRGNARGRGNVGAISANPGPGETVFNVLNYGAKSSSKENNMAFIKAWNAACQWKGKARLVIPQGEFLLGPVAFQGPCKGPSPIIVQLIGTLKASTDISEYDTAVWIGFEFINGIVIMGGGTLNGQGEIQWPLNNCRNNPNCQLLPASVRFSHVSNAIIRNIKSVNSMGFHYTLYGCSNFRAKSVRITAPENSPNTDGIHISNSTNVKIARSVIGTGDDCISIGQGSTNILINRITCGPGHGISVGSLGKYQNEDDVRGISVKNCTLINTENGIRIKTWPGSPPSQASGFIFQDIVMNSVKNPIIIDQEYCAKSKCGSKPPSRVKISNVNYDNIRGTSTSPVAVKVMCSRQFPCQNVKFINIDLKYAGPMARTMATSSTCMNANLGYAGRQNPPPCRK